MVPFLSPIKPGRNFLKSRVSEGIECTLTAKVESGLNLVKIHPTPFTSNPSQPLGQLNLVKLLSSRKKIRTKSILRWNKFFSENTNTNTTSIRGREQACTSFQTFNRKKILIVFGRNSFLFKIRIRTRKIRKEFPAEYYSYFFPA